jgi:hypothetical protein
VKKVAQKCCATSLIFRKLTKVSIHTMGENSPNLLALEEAKEEASFL